MGAKARATVRLAPSMLHALAYVAERRGIAPAEMAREIIGAGVERKLAENGWRRDWESTYRGWLAEQGARPGRAESPDQADYDQLADGTFSPASPALRSAQRQLEASGLPAVPATAPLAERLTGRRTRRDLGS